MPLPYRKLTALMTRYNGSNLLIDCGEGTQVAIREKGWSVHDLDVICFTHYHADHISGIPGLLLTLGNADRTKPVHMIGPKGLERVVNALRTIAPELPFPIEYHEITEKEQDFEMNGYCIHAFRVNHNVTCYGYTLEIKRQGRFDVERARRQEIPQKFWSGCMRRFLVYGRKTHGAGGWRTVCSSASESALTGRTSRRQSVGARAAAARSAIRSPFCQTARLCRAASTTRARLRWEICSGRNFPTFSPRRWPAQSARALKKGSAPPPYAAAAATQSGSEAGKEMPAQKGGQGKIRSGQMLPAFFID